MVFLVVFGVGFYSAATGQFTRPTHVVILVDADRLQIESFTAALSTDCPSVDREFPYPVRAVGAIGAVRDGKCPYFARTFDGEPTDKPRDAV